MQLLTFLMAGSCIPGIFLCPFPHPFASRRCNPRSVCVEAARSEQANKKFSNNGFHFKVSLSWAVFEYKGCLSMSCHICVSLCLCYCSGKVDSVGGG